jgi:hypothetical protein
MPRIHAWRRRPHFFSVIVGQRPPLLQLFSSSTIVGQSSTLQFHIFHVQPARSTLFGSRRHYHWLDTQRESMRYIDFLSLVHFWENRLFCDRVTKSIIMRTSWFFSLLRWGALSVVVSLSPQLRAKAPSSYAHSQVLDASNDVNVSWTLLLMLELPKIVCHFSRRAPYQHCPTRL